MTADAFLKLDPLKGESKDDKHPGWIEIETTGLDISIEPPDRETKLSSDQNSPPKPESSGSTDKNTQTIIDIINKSESNDKKELIDHLTSLSATPNEPFSLTITKKVDSLSTRLSQAAAKREPFTTATIDFCTYDGEQRKYLEYELSELAAQSYSVDGVNDTFKLVYKKIKLITYGKDKQKTGLFEYSTDTQSNQT